MLNVRVKVGLYVYLYEWLTRLVEWICLAPDGQSKTVYSPTYNCLWMLNIPLGEMARYIHQLRIKDVWTISSIHIKWKCLLSVYFCLSVCFSVSVSLPVSFSLYICMFAYPCLSAFCLQTREIRIPFAWPVNCEPAIRSGIHDIRSALLPPSLFSPCLFSSPHSFPFRPSNASFNPPSAGTQLRRQRLNSTESGKNPVTSVEMRNERLLPNHEVCKNVASICLCVPSCLYVCL